MGEKVYKPVLGKGAHLVRSKNNPERVRGQSRDSNNKNPDIVEWEEVDLDELYKDKVVPIPYENRQIELSPEEEKLAREMGELLAVAIERLLYDVVAPWFQYKLWPWIKKNTKKADNKVRRIKNDEVEIDNIQLVKVPAQFSAISDQIDHSCEQIYIDMDDEEIRSHLLNIVFHMLEIANEIRILSNARIRSECESEEKYIEQIKVSEKFLTDKVAENIDRLLSDKQYTFDVKTSLDIYSLMGGGVRMNGEYIPVESSRVYEAILAQDYDNKKKE